MTCALAQVLDFESLQSLLREDAPIDEIVEHLLAKGSHLAECITMIRHKDWGEFLRRHSEVDSELTDLEGASTIAGEKVAILMKCPMEPAIKKCLVEGQLPAHHHKIMDMYKEQNPGSNAILHPGCIAHQVARQVIIDRLQVSGKKLDVFQVACRNTSTGEVVYDDNGLVRMQISKLEAARLIDGHACLYVITID